MDQCLGELTCRPTTNTFNIVADIPRIQLDAFSQYPSIISMPHLGVMTAVWCEGLAQGINDNRARQKLWQFFWLMPRDFGQLFDSIHSLFVAFVAEISTVNLAVAHRGHGQVVLA